MIFLNNFVTRTLSSFVLISFVLLACFSSLGLVLLGFLGGMQIFELYAITKRINGIFISYGTIIVLGILCAYAQKPYLIWIFIFTWMHDVGGYLFGKLFKGPKLAPSISPNKTWSGLFGGILLGWITLIANQKFFNYPIPHFITVWPVAFANIAGVLGDMMESRIKRLYGLKDSSNFIPGHGGFLDRFDSFIIISILFYAFSKLSAFL